MGRRESNVTKLVTFLTMAKHAAYSVFRYNITILKHTSIWQVYEEKRVVVNK